MANGLCFQSLWEERIDKCFLYSQSGWHEGECQLKAVLKGPNHVGHLEEQWNPTKRAYPPRANGEAEHASRKVYHQGNQVKEEWQARRDVRTPRAPVGRMPSKHIPRFEETGISALQTPTSLSSLLPLTLGLGVRIWEQRSQSRRIQLCPVSIASFLPK